MHKRTFSQVQQAQTAFIRTNQQNETAKEIKEDKQIAPKLQPTHNEGGGIIASEGGKKKHHTPDEKANTAPSLVAIPRRGPRRGGTIALRLGHNRCSSLHQKGWHKNAHSRGARASIQPTKTTKILIYHHNHARGILRRSRGV